MAYFVNSTNLSIMIALPPMITVSKLTVASYMASSFSLVAPRLRAANSALVLSAPMAQVVVAWDWCSQQGLRGAATAGEPWASPPCISRSIPWCYLGIGLLVCGDKVCGIWKPIIFAHWLFYNMQIPTTSYNVFSPTTALLCITLPDIKQLPWEWLLQM